MLRWFLAIAFALPAVAFAQVTQTGSVVTPGGVAMQLVPVTQFVQSCNSGAGGIVGQNSCVAPASPVTATPAGLTYKHISTLATTTVKASAGVLHTVCVNTKGASATTATLYDNTAGSGTVIAVLDPTAATGCYIYDVAFATGLTIVTAVGTAGDITVSYQ